MTTRLNSAPVVANPYQTTLVQEDAESFGVQVLDVARYGIAGTLASAVGGIYNTGAALINWGFDADIKEQSTSAILDTLSMESAARYAEKNGWVDMAGFVAGAIVPGVLGVKAAKLAQKGLASADSSSRLVRGVRAALVPQDRIDELSTLIKSGQYSPATTTWSYGLQATKQGMHQQFVEAAFAETAILLTTNQHSMLNSDDLGYWDAIGANLDSLAFGTVFGGVIGGAFASVGNYSSLKKLANGVMEEANALSTYVPYGAFNATTPGNALANSVSAYHSIANSLRGIDAGNVQANKSVYNELARRRTDIQNQIIKELDGLFADVTKKQKGTSADADHLRSSIYNLIMNTPPEKIPGVLGGLKQVKSFDSDHLLFSSTLQPLKAITPTGVDNDALKSELWFIAKTTGRKYEDLAGDPIAINIAANEVKKSLKTARGWAWSNMPATVKAAGGTQFPSAFVVDNPARSLSQLLFTARHEIGHMAGNRLAPLFSALDNAAAAEGRRTFTSQMQELSRQMRPQNWEALDVFKQQEPTLKAMMKMAMGKGDNAMVDGIKEELERGYGMQRYLNKPEELIADTLAAFNRDKETHEQLADKFNDLYMVFAENGAARWRAQETEMLVSLKDGKQFKTADYYPNIADEGEVLIRRNPTSHVVQVVHSRGATTIGKFDPLKIESGTDASAYYYHAAKTTPSGNSMPKELSETDFPALTQLIRSGYKGELTLIKRDGSKEVLDLKSYATPEEGTAALKERVRQTKIEVATLMRNDPKYSPSGTLQSRELLETARILDVDLEWLEASAFQHKGNIGEAFYSLSTDVTKPTVAKMVYSQRNTLSQQEFTSMLEIQKTRSMQLQQAHQTSIGALTHYIKGINPKMFVAPSAGVRPNRATNATPLTGTQGIVKSANDEYGSVTELATTLGKATGHAESKAAEHIQLTMERHANAIHTDPAATHEYAFLDSKLRQAHYMEYTPEGVRVGESMKQFLSRVWIEKGATAKTAVARLKKLEEAGVLGYLDQLLTPASQTARLYTKDAVRVVQEVIEGGKLTPAKVQKLVAGFKDDVVEVKNEKVVQFFRSKVEHVQPMLVGLSKTAAAQKGKVVDWETKVWYPGRQDRAAAKHILYVQLKNPGAGNKALGMIMAPTPEALAAKRIALENKYGKEVLIQDQSQIDNALKNRLAIFDDALHVDDYFMDYGFKKDGIAFDMIPTVDPNMVYTHLADMKKQAAGAIKQLMQSAYADEFNAWEYAHNRVVMNAGAFGENSEKLAGSTAYSRLFNLALNQTDPNFYSKWSEVQRSVDKAFSSVYHAITGMGKGDKATADYAEMNKLAEQYGLPQVFSGQVGEFLQQTKAATPEILREAIPRLNWAASTLMLRLDLVQPIASVASFPVLAAPEIKHLVESLPELRKQQVTSMISVANPENGVLDVSNTRLMWKAAENWIKSPELRQRYSDMGLLTNVTKEYHEAVNAIAIDNEVWKQGLSGIKKSVATVADKLSVINDSSEEFLRFLAADIPRQVLEAGGITGDVADMAIRTFQNRVIGNYTYSQRPVMFQGWAGQAIGLFQTYQFNLIQQLLRHMGAGPARAGAMMALQSTIFGAKSLPGFDLLNQHIVEQSGGESDIYSNLAQATNNPVAEWALYGMGSNLLRPFFGDSLDISSRGNINPRSPTIIPAPWNPEEWVAFSMANKFWGAVSAAANNLANGADVWPTFTEALSHNGLNRPLQGIAEILAGQRTTNNGTFLLSTEDLNWIQMGARLMGSRGINETIAVDAYYRSNQMETARQERLNGVAQATRLMMSDGNFDSGDYSNAMAAYTEAGGNIQNFDKWTHSNFMRATTSDMWKMSQAHHTPEGRYYQSVMGAKVEQYVNPFNVPDTDYNIQMPEDSGM